MTKNNIIHFGMVHIILLVACILPSFIGDVSFFDSIAYFLFAVFCVFVPGLCIATFIRTKETSCIEMLFWSYVCGLFVALIEYLVAMLLGIAEYSLFVQLPILFVSILMLRKKKNTYSFDKYDYLFVLLMMISIVLISFFSVSCQHPLPSVFGETSYSKDFLYWIGNSISFTKGLPVQDFRLVGETFFYHYFSSVFIAQSHFVTGIDIYDISCSFSYIIPCLLLAVGAYSFAKKVTDNRLLVYMGIIGMLLCEGSTAYMLDHLYFCAFGFDYGYALSMAAVSWLIDMIEEDSYSLKNTIVTSLLIMMTTGFKGPNGAVMLMGFGVAAFALLLKRRWKDGMMVGFVWLLSFLFIYCVFVMNVFSNEEYANGLEFVGIGEAFDNNFWAISIFNDLVKNYGMPDNTITRLFAIVLYIFRINRLSTSMIIICLLLTAIRIRNKKIDIVSVLMFAIFAWGMLLTITTYQNGNSQMYFALSTIPFGIASGIRLLDETVSNRKALSTAIFVFLTLMMFDDISRGINDRIKPEIEKGISIRLKTDCELSGTYRFNMDDLSMSMWLKENTDSCDYIAIDEFDYDGLSKEEGFGVFSERFIWNDGQYSNEIERDRRREIVAGLLSGSTRAIGELKKDNVKYIVITKKINSDFKTGKDVALLKYENDLYRIYQLAN